MVNQGTKQEVFRLLVQANRAFPGAVSASQDGASSSAMARYQRKIETVDTGTQAEIETDRLWRQIDPQLYYLIKQKQD
jgi:hypothetical protein